MIYHLCPVKGIDFNYFIDTETYFDDMKSKKIRFENIEKNQRKFALKLSTVGIGSNKLNQQLSEIENITKLYKLWEEAIRFYMIILTHLETY